MHIKKVNGCGIWLECDGLLGNFKYHYLTAEILLDPKAWQAVAKSLGEGNTTVKNAPTLSKRFISKWARYKMHQMIDALIEGKDIETYLSEILK